MEYVLVAIVVTAAVVVIANDQLRHRRWLRSRLDLPAIVRSRLGEPHRGPDVAAALAATVARRDVVADRERSEPDASLDAEASGVWSVVEDAVDLETFRPKLAEGSELKRFRLRWGDDYAILASRDGTSHYILEIWEAEIVEMLDGTRTVAEVIVERLEGSGDLDVEAVGGLVEALRRAGVFDPAPVMLPEILPERMDPSSPSRRRLRAFLRDLRITWTGIDPLVRRIYRGGLHVLFRPVSVSIMGAIALLGLAAFVAVVLEGEYRLVVGRASVQTLILIGMGLLLTTAHEIGHAATLVHFDRRVLGAGFLLYYGSPAFFIDTSDGLMLDRRGRILQAFAGPFAEAALAGICSLLLFALPPGPVTNFLYKFAVINYYVIFLNLIPLLELDGYWILADAIEEPELRPRSIAFIRRELWQKLARREGFKIQEILFAVYGVVGIVFTLLTSILGLLLWKEVFGEIVLELWDSGLGTRVLLGFLVLFFAGPAIRGLITLFRSIGRRIRAIGRRIRFRAESSWRVEAASLIDDLPAFDDLPVELLNDLAGRVQLRSLGNGDTVFRQGDRADAFYVVRRGTVAIEDTDPVTGDARRLRVLGRGDSFGEAGLLERAPRTATVRALEAVEVFRVDANAFDRLLAEQIDAPRFAPTMQIYAELQALPQFQRLGLPQLAQLVEHGSFTNAAPGDVLVRQGDVGDAFYVLASGRVEVVRDGETVANLVGGDHFGEIALLEDVPRTASVIARTPVRVFRLAREGFDAVLANAFRTGAATRTIDRTSEH